MFDKDGNGSIEKKELQAVFAEMGKVFTDKEVEKMMEVADVDHSGSVDYEEFICAVFGATPRSGGD